MTRAKCAFGIFVVFFMIVVFSVAQQSNAPVGRDTPQQPSAVTEISADLGSCSVEFKVTDMVGKPIYDAKIKTQIRYGFLGKRKLDLEAGTNSSGLARFINMPDKVREPLVFQGTHDTDTMTMTWDPGTNCRAIYPMVLGKKPEQEPPGSSPQ